jgi:hypothetical protein
MSLAVLVIVASASTSACGGGRAAPRTSSRVPAASQSSLVGDTDAPSDKAYDGDDNSIHYYGRPATVAEEQAVARLVERYYAVAAARDGARACSLLHPMLAGSVVEQYGGSFGPPELRGKTCAVVMSKLFKEHRNRLAVDAATLRVTGVRVGGGQGYALLSWAEMPIGYIPIRREGDEWKVGALLGGPPA